MDDTQENDSVFSEMKPPIYSKGAIYGFSIFFSSIFGGVLLMQNLRDVGNHKEGNKILLLSGLYTILCIVILGTFPSKSSTFPLIFNIVGGLILSEYFYRQYFPDSNDYPKKTIWKALLISILISLPLVFFAIYSGQLKQ